PPGCGADLTAAPMEKILIVNFGHGTGLRDEFDLWNYVIRGYDNAGCTDGGVDVKALTDQKMTDYRTSNFIGSGIERVSYE
ncbi:hypothetical protein KIN20_011854, partial [Parelaphostrongylus tenuis]